MRSYVKPAVFTMWLILPNFLQTGGAPPSAPRVLLPPFWATRSARVVEETRDVLDGGVDDFFGEVIGGDIAADSKGVAARGLDLVNDDLRLLLVETVRGEVSRENASEVKHGR